MFLLLVPRTRPKQACARTVMAISAPMALHLRFQLEQLMKNASSSSNRDSRAINTASSRDALWDEGLTLSSRTGNDVDSVE